MYRFHCIKVFFVFGALILNFALTIESKAQTIESEQEPENFLHRLGLYPYDRINYRFDHYSIENLDAFKSKLEQLLKTPDADNWDDSYYYDLSEVGGDKIIIKSNSGFTRYNIYTCTPELQNFTFGNVKISPDTIKVFPTFSSYSDKKNEPETYVKVRWGNVKFLVEEDSLFAFAAKAVGLYVEPDENSSENLPRWDNYYVAGNTYVPFVGLPVFPSNYKKYQQLPVRTEIVSVGNKTVVKDLKVINGQYSSDTVTYKIKINAGSNNKIKVGLILTIPETKENLIITEVSKNSSTGLVVRWMDDDFNDEQCRNENSDIIPCPTLKTGMNAVTQIGNFHSF